MQKEATSVHAGFTEMYTGNPPWDIGRPQAPFIEIAEQVKGPVLDAGCGTGNGSLFFASLGLQVTGIDFVEEAIRRAKAKAAHRGLSVEFLVKDAMTLAAWDKRFESVIDSGLFHIYSGDDRRRYVHGLAHVTNPGGRLFLLSFSDEEAAVEGVSQQELHETFAEDWQVESVRTVRGELSPAFTAEFPEKYADGDPKMWFAIIRRKG
jgi:2-polyprenyl-3-methyl-5-hydroxy-6-metoxy-1,4-benzoquinol methylase